MGSKRREYFLDEQQMNRILPEIADNVKIAVICDSYAITPYFLFKSFEKQPLFRQKFDEARRIAAILSVETLNDDLDSCETPTDATIAKLKADNKRWRASKEARDIYGEKMELNVNQTLDISKVLNAADARIAPILHQHIPMLDVTPMKSNPYVDLTTGLEPVEESQSAEKVEAFDDLL